MQSTGAVEDTRLFHSSSLGRRMLAYGIEEKQGVALPRQLSLGDKNVLICHFKPDELVKERKMSFLTNPNVLQDSRISNQTAVIPVLVFCF